MRAGIEKARRYGRLAAQHDAAPAHEHSGRRTGPAEDDDRPGDHFRTGPVPGIARDDDDATAHPFSRTVARAAYDMDHAAPHSSHVPGARGSKKVGRIP